MAEAKTKKKYRYEGPVSRYGVCIAPNWEAETVAETTSKAYANLKFRFNTETGMCAYIPLQFGGKLEEVA